jgi:hypothetical protein
MDLKTDISEEDKLQNLIVSGFHTKEMQDVYRNNALRGFNYLESIQSGKTTLTSIVNGAITEITKGVSPKSALDKIASIAEAMCAENSAQ